jgi:hypothetical protein
MRKHRPVAGLHAYRLTDKAFNRIEVAFAKQWAAKSQSSDIVKFIMEVPSESGEAVVGAFGAQRVVFPIGKTKPRDRILAATIIQWLGTPCGFCFLEESRARCGYRVVEKKKKGGA